MPLYRIYKLAVAHTDILYNTRMAIKRASVALLIIGNEILSGRTHEKNLAELSVLLIERGLRLCEARIVADVKSDIVSALNALRQRYDYVFTSGGIGPTHDDITTDAVAAAFSVRVVENSQAAEKLAAFYRERSLPFTPSRRRMACFPESAEMLESEFPGAPAYQLENVIVCAGVPAIFRLMAKAAVERLPQAAVWQSSSLVVLCGESIFAATLADIAATFLELEIGSYPRDEGGILKCQVVFSGDSIPVIDQAKAAFIEYLRCENLPFEWQ